ncbi:MAG: hypothetical protein KC592_06995 [Nitrospira sp.]|nr:hypothetical protein [Nitrospira sp.]
MAHSAKILVLVIMTAITMLTGCASGPPAKLLERHDHAALARWYEQEAATLRQRAEEMRTMIRESRDYDSQGFYMDRLTLMKHCDDLADDYSKAADKAEELAQIHRGRHAAQ